MAQPYVSEYVEDVPFEAFIEEQAPYIVEEGQPYRDLAYQGYEGGPHAEIAYQELEAESYEGFSGEYGSAGQAAYATYYSAPGYQAPGEPFLPFLMIAPVAVLIVSVVLVISLGIIKIGPLPAPQIAAPALPVEASEPEAPAAPAIPGALSPLFTPSIQYWREQIISWSEAWGLDPNMVATVMQIESCGDPSVTSSAGAMGLFQVMPFHFENGEDGYDTQTNARRGLAYLIKSLQAHGGDTRLAFAGYNGGIGGSQRPESQWHSETKRYVYWATGIYEDAQAGKEQSGRLEEWLARGGGGLCERASRTLGLNP